MIINKTGLVAVVIVAAGFLPVVQDGSEPAVRATDPQPTMTVQAPAKHVLGGAVTAETLVSVSEVALDAADGTGIRFVIVASTSSVGQVILEQAFKITKVSVSANEPVTVTTDKMNTGVAHLIAADLLDTVSEPESSYLAAGQEIEEHEIRVAPAPGLAWGAVKSPSDLQITAARATR